MVKRHVYLSASFNFGVRCHALKLAAICFTPSNIPMGQYLVPYCFRSRNFIIVISSSTTTVIIIIMERVCHGRVVGTRDSWSLEVTPDSGSIPLCVTKCSEFPCLYCPWGSVEVTRQWGSLMLSCMELTGKHSPSNNGIYVTRKKLRRAPHDRVVRVD